MHIPTYPPPHTYAYAHHCQAPCPQKHSLSWHCSRVVVSRDDALWDDVCLPCDAWVTGPHAGPEPLVTLHPEGHVQAAVPRQYQVCMFDAPQLLRNCATPGATRRP